MIRDSALWPESFRCVAAGSPDGVLLDHLRPHPAGPVSVPALCLPAGFQRSWGKTLITPVHKACAGPSLCRLSFI